MRGILMVAAASAGGWLGWRLGSPAGVMSAYLLSVIGSGAGVYACWKLNRYLD